MATRSTLTALRLGAGDEPAVARLLDLEPVQNAYMRSELRFGLDRGEWWGVDGPAGPTAVMLGGSLVVPWIPDPDDADVLAEPLSARALRMLVGPRESVMALHRVSRRQAREIRDPQLLFALRRGRVAMHPKAPLRRARRGDLDVLVQAAAAMHREEMGVDPLAVDAVGWRTMMSTLIDRGWAWVWIEAGEVIFKAELSAWTNEAVQIQGVYTAPNHRRQGVATAGLATVCDALLREAAACSLYANHFNHVAISLYRRLGFELAGSFATVIY